MENLVYVIIVAVIIIGMMISVWYLYKKSLIKLKTVHAGSANRRTGNDDSTNLKLSLFDTFYHQGRKVNPKDYEVRIVEQDCMEARGIADGDILFIKMFSKNDNKEAMIKKGDVLFINKKYEDKILYKIREFEGYNANGEVLTFSYNKDGSHSPSSSPHSIDRIDGIVRMGFKSKWSR